ncbi:MULTISPECIES: hypothetical protein [unclassified Thiocapsa]|uniref:hypothetical protein n=1 Tax=unclassified Thiocapsa TaxID=2641286 RepID=UPI0035B0FD97
MTPFRSICLLRAAVSLRLVAMGGGRSRIPLGIEKMLRINIFDPVRLVPTAGPSLTRLLAATRMA